MLTRIVLILGVLAVLGGFGGCKKDSSNPSAPQPSAPAATTVTIANMAFSPASLTVAKGTTVTWKNMDGVGHTATSNTGAWDTGAIASGASASVTFNTAGAFPYHCTVHPQMVATITVQ